MLSLSKVIFISILLLYCFNSLSLKSLIEIDPFSQFDRTKQLAYIKPKKQIGSCNGVRENYFSLRFYHIIIYFNRFLSCLNLIIIVTQKQVI